MSRDAISIKGRMEEESQIMAFAFLKITLCPTFTSSWKRNMKSVQRLMSCIVENVSLMPLSEEKLNYWTFKALSRADFSSLRTKLCFAKTSNERNHISTLIILFEISRSKSIEIFIHFSTPADRKHEMILCVPEPKTKRKKMKTEEDDDDVCLTVKVCIGWSWV